MLYAEDIDKDKEPSDFDKIEIIMVRASWISVHHMSGLITPVTNIKIICDSGHSSPLVGLGIALTHIPHQQVLVAQHPVGGLDLPQLTMSTPCHFGETLIQLSGYNDLAFVKITQICTSAFNTSTMSIEC